MLNTHLQYPLNEFWVSDRTKNTITLGTTDDFQEIVSPGNGSMEPIGKDEIMLSFKFKEFEIQIMMFPVQAYQKERVEKGEPIGFALEGHIQMWGTKVATATYAVNPLSTLFVHPNQRCISSVPFATPKIIFR